jgi:hypothetical protein
MPNTERKWRMYKLAVVNAIKQFFTKDNKKFMTADNKEFKVKE